MVGELKKILFIKGFSVYNAVRFFVDKLEEGFKKRNFQHAF